MDMEIEEQDFNKTTENFNLNPIKVPKYLMDLDEYLKTNKVPSTFDCSDFNVENTIIYGLKCFLEEPAGKFKPCTIFQEDPEPKILSIIIEGSEKMEHLDITMITHVSIVEGKEPKVNVQIDSLSFNFKFKNPEQLYLLLRALLLLYTKNVLTDDSNLRNQTLKIWQKYDNNFDNILDEEEFAKFFNDINAGGLNITKLSQKEFFEIVDTNKDKKIQYNEFFDFYSKYTKGTEFQRFFLQYSTDKLNLSCKDLQTFIKQEQRETATLSDCAELIITCKQGLSMQEKQKYKDQIRNATNVKSEDLLNINMTLQEFKLYMINILQNNIMKMNDDVPSTFPLNDYFICSSHNTYLKGNQLTSEASPEMYSQALSEGYKLVELDCYSPDSTGDVVITHGFTFTGKCYLKPVMMKIKEKAFIDNNNPVILSVENHMNEEGQKIFVSYCQNILQNLYIIDPNNLPPSYPTLKQLQNKFIIKLSGKRVTYNEEQIHKKLQSSAKKKKSKEKIPMEKEKTVDNLIKEEKGNDVLKRKNVMTVNNSEALAEVEKKYEEDIKEPETVAISEIEAIRGITKTKFELDEDYISRMGPWEFVSVKSGKLLNLSSYTESRSLLVKLSKNGFLKAFPESLTSANYNPVHLWLSGAQICALNIQSLVDDSILINKQFFKSYGNNGYILKPKKLQHNSSTGVEIYDFPYGTIEIEVISLNGLFHHIKERNVDTNNKKITTEISLIGSDADESKNQMFTTEIKGNLIMYEFCSEEEENKTNLFIFDIYEKNLSFVFFKILVADLVVAKSCVPVERMKEGIRAISLYDDTCSEINNASLVCRIKKNFSNKKLKRE